jgi:electron transfer flavoprotein alpha subunit
MILVVAEQRGGVPVRATWEAVAAAQQTAGDEAVAVVVLGAENDRAAADLAAAQVRDVLTLTDTALALYTPDPYVTVLEQAIKALAPSLVLLPHTYQTRDFAPALAARLECALVTDVIGIKGHGGAARVFVRPMFQGRLVADVVAQGDGPHVATLQVGAFRADQVARGASPATIRAFPVAVDPARIRQRPEPPFREARQAVDLSQAERIVAVGRGIKGPEHLPLVQALAAALDAELAASRPICDAGWLPMERQVGSSGQTVAPKLYLALGISGAIQHLVGMKGARVIAAVNTDPDAPIFEIADYGIVGDVFDGVPALLDALKE